jgi:hypothetical protein
MISTGNNLLLLRTGDEKQMLEFVRQGPAYERTDGEGGRMEWFCQHTATLKCELIAEKRRTVSLVTPLGRWSILFRTSPSIDR